MKLVALTFDDVYARWDWLRDGLLRMVDKTGAHYRPEDVYARLLGDTAWAYDFGVGFIILTKEYDPDGLVLFVWALHADSGTLGRQGSDELYVELEQLARGAKAKRIRMQSPRRGWERETFFNKVSVVYEHEVTCTTM